MGRIQARSQKVEILYIVTLHKQIQALNAMSIFILNSSRTMTESLSLLQ